MKEMNNEATNKTLTSGQFTANRKTLEPIALEAGLTKNWFKNWFNNYKRDLEEYQATGKIPSAASAPNNGSDYETGATGSESSECGNGLRSGLEQPDATTPPPTTHLLVPRKAGRLQTASAEDTAMWQEISRTSRKAGGSAAIKQKYGEKGSWAILINQKINDILSEADERQTIIKECID